MSGSLLLLDKAGAASKGLDASLDAEALSGSAALQIGSRVNVLERLVVVGVDSHVRRCGT